MHTSFIETPEHKTEPVGTAVPADVATVGTFAEGQSAHGSFQVAAAADLGSFASAPPVDRSHDTP